MKLKEDRKTYEIGFQL